MQEVELSPELRELIEGQLAWFGQAQRERPRLQSLLSRAEATTPASPAEAELLGLMIGFMKIQLTALARWLDDESSAEPKPHHYLGTELDALRSQLQTLRIDAFYWLPLQRWLREEPGATPPAGFADFVARMGRRPEWRDALARFQRDLPAFLEELETLERSEREIDQGAPLKERVEAYRALGIPKLAGVHFRLAGLFKPLVAYEDFNRFVYWQIALAPEPPSSSRTPVTGPLAEEVASLGAKVRGLLRKATGRL